MNKKQKAVYIYFLLLPIIDVITSLIVRFTDFKISFGVVIKGITLLFMMIYTIWFSKSQWKKRSLQYFIIVFIFFILYVITKIPIFSFRFLVDEMVMASHYFYFPLMIIGIMNLFEDLKIENKLVHKILIIGSITYGVLLLIPLISGTGFNSYRWNNFFGNNGWFFSANEVGTITVLLLSSMAYFLLPDKKCRVIIAGLILVSIAFIGTKVSLAGMFLMVVLIIIFLIIKWKKKALIMSSLLIVMAVLAGMFSPTVSNIGMSSKIIAMDEEETRDIRRLEEFIDDEKLIDMIKLVLNGREDFFVTNLYVYNHSNVVNKFMGIGWTDWEEIDYTYERKLIEIDYLDIFIHYGIIGFIVYFMPLIYLFIYIVKYKKKKTYYFWYNVMVFLIGILISSMAGHVLSAPAVSIYLVLILYLIMNGLKGNGKNEKDSNFY